MSGESHGKGWRRIAIEFVVIVAGVMVALAANGWTSSLEDRKKERAHLEQLLADFRSNDAIALEAVRVKTNYADAAAHVLAVVTNKSTSHDMPLPVDVELAGWNYIPQFVNEAWQDLVATGEIRLIRSDEIRRQISYFYQFNSNVGTMEQEWRNYMLSYRSSVSSVVDPYLRLRILQLYPNRQALKDSLGAREPNAVITARLLQVPALGGKLADVVMVQRTGAYYYQGATKGIREIKSLIENELQKK